MKALFFRQHGTIEQLEYGDIELPEIGSDDVLLKVKAAGLNRLDLWVLAGWPGLRLNFPHVMGSDGSGVVVKTGSNVLDYSPGDRVAVNPTRSCSRCSYCRSGRDNMCVRFAIFGEHIPGFFGEYQVVPARNLLKLPDNVSHEIAAAASLVYVTAWHSLIETGGLKTGEDVLIIGAGGGVNTAYIDIARLAGAGKIFVVGSSDDKLMLAHQLGAQVTINRHQENWSKVVYERTNRQGVDVVVDNVGAATFQDSLRTLKKGGRLLTVGNTSGPKVEVDNRYVFGRQLKIIGTTMGPHQDYIKVMKLIFDGRLSPAIDAVFPLADGIEALRRLEAGEVRGKLLIIP